MPKPLETWQLWRQFKLHLGESFLMKVMGKSNARTIRMYSQDPRTTDDRCKDPLESLHIIFTEADEIGRSDIVHRSIDYLLTSLSENTYDLPQARELLPTMDAEQLEDFQALASFHKAIADGSDIDMIESSMKSTILAIERTFAKLVRG